MAKIYANSEEKYLKTVILYGDVNSYLYYDKEKTNKVSGKDAFSLFIKGLMFICDEDSMDVVGLTIPTSISLLSDDIDTETATMVHVAFVDAAGGAHQYKYLVDNS